MDIVKFPPPACEISGISYRLQTALYTLQAGWLDSDYNSWLVSCALGGFAFLCMERTPCLNLMVFIPRLQRSAIHIELGCIESVLMYTCMPISEHIIAIKNAQVQGQACNQNSMEQSFWPAQRVATPSQYLDLCIASTYTHLNSGHLVTSMRSAAVQLALKR